MRPHPRIRKTIKWGASAVALMLIAVMVWSSDQMLLRRWEDLSGGYEAAVGQGLVFYTSTSWMDDFGSTPPPPGVYRLQLNERKIRWWFTEYNATNGVRHEVPLWIPAFALSVTAAWAWRLDTLATRRAKLGACPTCSYPRTGLAPSSPCPECGSAAPSA